MLGGACEFENPELTELRVWSIKGFEHYLIFYLPIDDDIDVIRVLHASRDVENILRGRTESLTGTIADTNLR
jgi:plasmid stabilization system protein ParE